ncbi:AAA family ATPase [Desulfurococcus amylolyticus]|uniref:AAA family ATPase n=1 Tax=Desulfurococcus amylolyticus TaxID=94694 RepID=UPI0005B20BCD|nr:SMC family ATPase [Desulfurococcus amylolyticus]
MRIYGLMLENIRSFKNEYIVFPKKGVTVIHGETGSGKTSILMSISAALFGLQKEGKDPFRAFAYPTGKDLLRADALRGRIRLLFEHEGRVYLVEREFKRSSNSVVNVDRNRLEEYIIKEDKLIKVNSLILGTEELNKRIREILGIKERAREKPLLFTSVLYAPQFNIHEILSLDSEERGEIIERSLGLYKYKEYKNNSNAVRDMIKDKIDELTDKIDGLKKKLKDKNKEKLLEEKQRLEKQLKELEKILVEKQKERDELDKRIKEHQNRLRDMERRIGELQSRIGQARKQEARLKDVRNELAKIALNLGKNASTGYTELLEELRRREREIEGKVRELQDIESELVDKRKEIEEELNEAKRKREDIMMRLGRLEADEENLTRQEQELNKQLEKYRDLLNKGICPLCLQPIPHEHGIKLIDEVQGRLEEVGKKIRELKEEETSRYKELEDINKRINALEENREEVEEKLDKVRRDSTRLLQELLSLKHTAEKINSLVDEASRIEKEISEARSLEEELARINSEKENTISIIHELEDKYREAKEKLEGLIAEKAGTEKSIKYIELEIQDIEKEEDELRQLEDEKKFHEWMDTTMNILDKLVDEVEKRVSLEMVSEFRRIFYMILDTLLQGQPVEVGIRDDFIIEPKIRIGGRIYTISSLSGGQNIAISLAYRLALNATVRTYSPFLRKTVLILDEPTTGFSQELVKRLSEVLRKIGDLEGQVIVVTHDELLKEIGDCKIMLERDPINHVSKVREQECDIEEFNKFKNLVEGLLRGSLQVDTVKMEKIEVEPAGFKPEVRLGAGTVQQAKRKSLFDFHDKPK